jgi:hypothetical protein
LPLKRDFGHSVSKKVEEMLDYTHASSRNASSGFGKLFLVSTAIGAVAWYVRKQKIQLTGRHKKREFEFGSFPSSKGSTKYRDS